MIYGKRNLEAIQGLGDKTKALALKWHEYCERHGIEILIYETIRTKEKQAEYVKRGASQTMRSYHLVGQALDFVPIDPHGEEIWNGYKAADIQKAIREAKRLGFTWGGDWTSFVDSPHLQYGRIGYGNDTFNKKSVIAPVVTVKLPPVIVNKKYVSLVDYLKHKKLNSSFAARKILAANHGIKNYTGTASQNTKLLNALQK